MWQRKGNLKKETESLLIAAQNNAIRTKHIKARIDKTQQNSRCRLCGDRDKTINHIIREYSKLAPKGYKTRHIKVSKVIHWELCKKLKFDYTNKWYMHNPESVLENKTQKFLWDFEIQTDHLISARRLDLVRTKKKKKKRKEKKKKKNMQNCCPGWLQSKIERISTSTLLGNWKICVTGKWGLYQL